MQKKRTSRHIQSRKNRFIWNDDSAGISAELCRDPDTDQPGRSGVKLGLANLASIVSLYLLGSRCGSGDCIGTYRAGRIYVWKPVDDAV